MFSTEYFSLGPILGVFWRTKLSLTKDLKMFPSWYCTCFLDNENIFCNVNIKLLSQTMEKERSGDTVACTS